MLDWRFARDEALLALERAKDPAVRAEAADALCGLASRLSQEHAQEFAPAIVRLLTDAQAEVRRAGLALAAHVLSPDEAAEVLIRHLTEPSVGVRSEAAGRLADLELAHHRGALAHCLDDAAFPVRFEAARGMALLKHPAGREVLLQALEQPDFRFRAVATLVDLGDASVLPHLEKLFSRWFLPAFERTQLAGALARLGQPAGLAHLHKRIARRWSEDRAMAVELLGEVGGAQARSTLEKVLADREDLCRGAAARALARLGDPGALALLQRALDGADDDLKLDVVEALLMLQTPEAQALARAVTVEDEAAREELREIFEDAQAAEPSRPSGARG
jgi:HEAT repeat protein